MEHAKAAYQADALTQERKATRLLDAERLAQEDRMERESQRTSALS